jgi:hypothetical protein
MAWQKFLSTKPDENDYGIDVAVSMRDNFNAQLAWMVVNGFDIAPWVPTNNSNGTSIPYAKPTELYQREGLAATAGSVWFRQTVTYGTSGASLDLPVTITYEVSFNGGTTYERMTHEDGTNKITVTYYSTGQLPTYVWSVS